MAGYSPRPLARKLGLKPDHRVVFEAMPDSVLQEILKETPGLSPGKAPNGAPLDVLMVFATEAAPLALRLAEARQQIAKNGMIWVAWPKKASKVKTDITEDVVREEAFPHGLVDVKVCAVDEIWSGLKLVIRRELR